MLMPRLKSFLVLFLLSMVFNTIAQTKEKLTSDDYFADGDYASALKEYLKEEKKAPKDETIKGRLAECYLAMRGDKTKAIPYLEFLNKKHPDDTSILLRLGGAYQLDYKFDEAMDCFTKYNEKAVPKQKALIDKTIEACKSAKEMIKHPVAVYFENLGPNVNSKFPDYYPFVTRDERTLYFTTRRSETKGNVKSAYGYWSSDVFVSVKDDKGQWTRAGSLGNAINTEDDDECVGISADGKNIILYKDKKNIFSDLLHAEFNEKKRNFGAPVLFNEPINTKNLELEGCYGVDLKTLYFASDRKGTFGSADIFVSHVLPDGKWSAPQNLGPNINTKDDEGFPYISADGQTLYFTSTGHGGMGGVDIFKSQWDSAKKEWQKPTNMGYPINTPDDDLMYSLAGNGIDGYLATCRKEGMGDLDIYKVIFTEADKLNTTVRGIVNFLGATKAGLEATVSISNALTLVELETKTVNPKEAQYSFVATPGKYLIKITAKGFKTLQQEVIVPGKADFKNEVEYNLTLIPGT